MNQEEKKCSVRMLFFCSFAFLEQAKLKFLFCCDTKNRTSLFFLWLTFGGVKFGLGIEKYC